MSCYTLLDRLVWLVKIFFFFVVLFLSLKFCCTEHEWNEMFHLFVSSFIYPSYIYVTPPLSLPFQINSAFSIVWIYVWWFAFTYAMFLSFFLFFLCYGILNYWNLKFFVFKLTKTFAIAFHILYFSLNYFLLLYFIALKLQKPYYVTLF